MHNPAPAYIIEPATLGDIGDMDRIEQEAFATPWSRELIRGAITNRQYRVRVLRSREGGLVGFYIAHGSTRSSNMDNFAVDAWARGRGLGSLLLDDWIASAGRDGCDTLTLQVNTHNVRAQRLYVRYHFQTSRLLAAYYPNGDDAFQMQRVLSAPPLRRGGRARMTIVDPA